jgi:hypothetical protein
MNARTRFLWIALIVISALCLQACGVSMIKGENWLASKTEKTEMNVSGSWMSPEWGDAKLLQQGKNITGTLGDYPVKGTVSGNDLYLLMYSGDKIHYFAELKAADKNTFKGLYSEKYGTFDDAKNAPVLKRQMSLTKTAAQ